MTPGRVDCGQAQIDPPLRALRRQIEGRILAARSPRRPGLARAWIHDQPHPTRGLPPRSPPRPPAAHPKSSNFTRSGRLAARRLRRVRTPNYWHGRTTPFGTLGWRVSPPDAQWAVQSAKLPGKSVAFAVETTQLNAPTLCVCARPGSSSGRPANSADGAHTIAAESDWPCGFVNAAQQNRPVGNGAVHFGRRDPDCCLVRTWCLAPAACPGIFRSHN